MIKFAIIGCGRIAKRHISLLAENKIQGACLKAVCDINESRAKSYGEKYNINHYADIDNMLLSEDVDIVAILTPSGLHAEHVIKATKHKKHVLVEKPMALTLDDADAMIRACDENSVRLFVVKQNRFNLPVQKLLEAKNSGRFGKMVLGTVRVRWCRLQSYYDQDDWRGTWALDGGVLANQASHHIDLLEWMLGSVDSVFAKSTTALVNIEVEDTAVVILKFKNGALGVVEATTAARPEDLEGSLSLLGENGTVEISGLAVNEIKIWKFTNKLLEDREVLEKFSVNPPDVYGFGHKAYYDHLVHCMQNDKQHLIDGLEGRKSLEIITAMYESIHTGKEVHLSNRSGNCKLGLR